MTLPILPTYYYLDHFTEMLSFVETSYATILDTSDHEFIRDFRRLPADEQYLFVRMVNRRGHIFAPATLKYAEVLVCVGCDLVMFIFLSDFDDGFAL